MLVILLAASVDWPIAPVKAQNDLLARNKLTVDDIALFEINEAFRFFVRHLHCTDLHCTDEWISSRGDFTMHS